MMQMAFELVNRHYNFHEQSGYVLKLAMLLKKIAILNALCIGKYFCSLNRDHSGHSDHIRYNSHSGQS